MNDLMHARRAFLIGLWLAALCPFTANYAAVPLTEVWAIFLTTLASLFLGAVIASAAGVASLGQWPVTGSNYWLAAALAGFAVASALLPPGSAAPSLNRVPRPGRHSSAPGRIQALGAHPGTRVLEPRCPSFPDRPQCPKPPRISTAHSQGRTLPATRPKGFMAWERTWLYRVRDCYLVSWKLNDEEMRSATCRQMPLSTPEERNRVAAVLEKYNEDLTLTRKRTPSSPNSPVNAPSAPWRTYLTIPLRRAFRIWFYAANRARPVSGNVFPLWYMHQEDAWTSASPSSFSS